MIRWLHRRKLCGQESKPERSRLLEVTGCRLLFSDHENPGPGIRVCDGAGIPHPCEDEVAKQLSDLLAKRLQYIEKDGDAFFNAA